MEFGRHSETEMISRILRNTEKLMSQQDDINAAART